MMSDLIGMMSDVLIDIISVNKPALYTHWFYSTRYNGLLHLENYDMKFASLLSI
jgi:hypothetical protein